MHMSDTLKTTVLNAWHRAHGGQMVEFGGWDMPVAYDRGILQEHLSTRKTGGLFDISHMGRFAVRGRDVVGFLQYALTNNCAGLEPGMAQYTVIADQEGCAVDDAYLYRLEEAGGKAGQFFLLVVNASNAEKDWAWLKGIQSRFPSVTLDNLTSELAMISVQGPQTKKLLELLLDQGRAALPDPWRNRLRLCCMEEESIPVTVSRTGYTGEPLGFELFLPAAHAVQVWEKILASGLDIVPVGLGARDTLRLEAGLPLYGHELGIDHEGKGIPILAAPSTSTGVSFSAEKGDFVGREALRRQKDELTTRASLGAAAPAGKALPRVVVPVAVTGRGIVRGGYTVFAGSRFVGHVTSGTMVPYWKFTDEGLSSAPSEEKGTRALALAYLDADLEKGQTVQIRQGDRDFEGVIVPRHLSSAAPPFARPVIVSSMAPAATHAARGLSESSRMIVEKAIQNTTWRQRQTINLIPSEQTTSPLVSMLSIMDPAHRYAEHRRVSVLGEKDVFYYQGTGMIEEVERLVQAELRAYLGCTEVETRVISGQMANTAVFGGLVDYLNRRDRKSEPRRLRKVVNHHIGRGGHLSAQPMGALKSFVSVDPVTDRPAVVAFPTLREDPYRIDIARTEEVIAQHKPELIILGKSMVLYKEPVREIARMISGMTPRPILMYDMAHVLGLVGPDFQEPFAEGADIVTGSTHKTFFGPQRGIIASTMSRGSALDHLWDAIVRRVFPGSVSNHHLGTLLGLLAASYEMNAFKAQYQKAVITNAKAFARSLKDAGLTVEGDPRLGYTETHQVLVRVGYGKAPRVAETLEANNIILNYQAAPDDEGFTASSCLRMGVQEMTRFGMEQGDFARLAELMGDVILRGRSVREEVTRFRSKFIQMRYCLPHDELMALSRKLWETMA
jgi:aminomethyltransferase